MSVNALLGTRQPRAAGGRAPRPARGGAVLRRGGRALPRRALPDLPRRPHRHAAPSSCPSGRTRRRSSAPSTGPCCATRRSRPTTCSAGSRRSRPTPAGTALLFTGDRDMFQCVSESVTVLWPAGKGETEPIGPAEVRARYGMRPEQVPDFIALRGDPSDGLPGAKGIGEKTARELLHRARQPRRAARAAHHPAPARAPVADRPGRRAARVPGDRDAAADRRRAPRRRADRLRGRRRRRARAIDEPTCGAT